MAAGDELKVVGNGNRRKNRDDCHHYYHLNQGKASHRKLLLAPPMAACLANDLEVHQSHLPTLFYLIGRHVLSG